MPPLKGVDRGLNGNALKALEESGHEDKIVIVDPSYSIPEGAKVIDYQGDSSAQALRGILNLVPHEPLALDGWDATCMAADSAEEECPARDAFKKVAGELGLALGTRTRHGTDEYPGGFYSRANGLERPTLFVRTRDEKAYACAMFIVGHSQE